MGGGCGSEGASSPDYSQKSSVAGDGQGRRLRFFSGSACHGPSSSPHTASSAASMLSGWLERGGVGFEEEVEEFGRKRVGRKRVDRAESRFPVDDSLRWQAWACWGWLGAWSGGGGRCCCWSLDDTRWLVSRCGGELSSVMSTAVSSSLGAGADRVRRENQEVLVLAVICAARSRQWPGEL